MINSSAITGIAPDATIFSAEKDTSQEEKVSSLIGFQPKKPEDVVEANPVNEALFETAKQEKSRAVTTEPIDPKYLPINSLAGISEDTKNNKITELGFNKEVEKTKKTANGIQ